LKYYDVFVEDRQTKQSVCVLSMATRNEALDIVNYLSRFSACAIYFIQTEWSTKNET
jgi:hypothetical protein